ncbi:MAG: type II secretion system protein [Desulfosalsimonas sp.]
MTIISKDSRGFTLIEVIVSLVILGVLATVSTIAIVKIVEGYQLAKDNAHLTQKAQVAMTRIAVELNYATEVEIPGNSNTIIYTAEYPAEDPDCTTVSEDNRIRRTQQENLILREGNDSYILADGVSGFNASRPPEEEDYRDYMVDIELSMEGANGVEQNFTTSIAHR